MARGRLAGNINAKNVSDVTFPCRVSAQLDEDGHMTLSVTSTGEYIEGGTVSATLEMDDLPKDLVDKLKKLMQTILSEAHDDLKDEFQRERLNAINLASAVKPPVQA